MTPVNSAVNSTVTNMKHTSGSTADNISGNNQVTPTQIGKWLCERDAMFLNYTGITLLNIEDGSALLEMIVKPEMLNSGEVCQGGILFSLADQACAYACLADNHKGSTLSADIVYTKSAKLGDILRAEAKLVSNQRRTATCDVTINNQNNEQIALFRGIWYRSNSVLIDVAEST